MAPAGSLLIPPAGNFVYLTLEASLPQIEIW
jgi:hypothetical protein